MTDPVLALIAIRLAVLVGLLALAAPANSRVRDLAFPAAATKAAGSSTGLLADPRASQDAELRDMCLHD